MAKFKAKGCVFKYGSANPPTTTIGQAGDSTIDLGERAGAIDITTHDNSTGTFDKMDPGFKEPFNFSGEILWDPADATHEILRAALESGSAGFLEVTLPDAGTAKWVVSARVKSVGLPLPVNGKLSANVSIEGMAASTFTA